MYDCHSLDVQSVALPRNNTQLSSVFQEGCVCVSELLNLPLRIPNPAQTGPVPVTPPTAPPCPFHPAHPRPNLPRAAAATPPPASAALAPPSSASPLPSETPAATNNRPLFISHNLRLFSSTHQQIKENQRNPGSG